MFATSRSPTMTHTTEKNCAEKGINNPPPPFLTFRILRQTSWCHISRVPPPPPLIVSWRWTTAPPMTPGTGGALLQRRGAAWSNDHLLIRR